MSLEHLISQERYYGSIPYTETSTNHQRFSDVVNSAGLAGCQNQAWCATYQFALEVEEYGVNDALSHWQMAKSSYVGYSVFSTRDHFKAAGKTGATPKIGALVIFKQSHMGRVLSISGNTFECGEGNTSNAQFNRDGDSCAVKTYSVTDSKIDCFCYIDYENEVQPMTGWDLRVQCSSITTQARANGWKYGDSKTLPPCGDKTISCDRMIARALWNLGYTQQPTGGVTVVNMESYLTKWGFSKITNSSKLLPGDIVLFAYDGETSPTWRWHTFLVDNVRSNGLIDKYDCGSQSRLQTAQPFKNAALDEWSDKHFYCAFRAPSNATVEDGYYRLVSALDDNYLMDVAGGSLEKRANIQLYKRNGTDAQVFRIKPAGDDTYVFDNKQSGMVFDIAGGSVVRGANLQQYKWNATDAQRFYIRPASKSDYYVIINKRSGLALDVESAKVAKRTNIRQWRPNNTLAQMWKLEKV